MNLGLVFEQGNFVLIGVFLILVIMSITTWTVIVIRSIKLYRAKRGDTQAREAIWSAKSWQDAQQKATQIPSPISDLTLALAKAKHQYQHNKNGHLAEALPLNEFLMRHFNNNIHKILRRFDGGLTALASIGATAPFIGLFGTVWGIYHALINISHSGQMSIAAVAGPIGEALVATAAGLFVAIPAVLAYNALMRCNKNLAQDIDSYAHDLHVQLLNSED